MQTLFNQLPEWIRIAVALLGTLAAVLAAHWIALKLVQGAASRTRLAADDILVGRLARPSRWVLVALALSSAQPALGLDEAGLRLWSRVAGLLFPALLGWLVIAMLGAGLDLLQARADIGVSDNLRARRRRTRAGILHRVAVFAVLVIVFCLMLMSIPSVRSIGVTLIASAGLAGLAVGAAAQPALKNLIAGIQMAFTEPIRIDDVVVIEGEWGRIEDIRLTYVVVKIWDERRLIVPVVKFLEAAFENWTREASQITGAVIWHFDPAADVGRLRAKLSELVQANSRWDGRFFNLQVTDSKPDTIEVRALMTAKDASTAFDLRCGVREAMLAFVRAEMPEALVRVRLDQGQSRSSRERP